MLIIIFQTVATMSLVLWISLFFFRGRFWLADQFLSNDLTALDTWPSVAIVIPARNEEAYVNTALQSLLAQNYPGKLNITVVNDDSSDDTVGEISRIENNKIKLLNSSELPKGWTGKLWALKQGISFSKQQNPLADYLLLTDADIKHSPDNLKNLVMKAERESLQLVSLMVLLNCSTFWERLLIPAFVFFFQKLYPFPWINDPRKTSAGAAGGCILVKSDALEMAGGIDAVRNELIDDCAIGRIIKMNGPIWLGLTKEVKSLRKYAHLSEIWGMVTRTAFEQLKCSSIVLLVTIIGMTVIYVIPPSALACGLILGDYFLGLLGALSWSIMTIAYVPTLRLYKQPDWAAISLPAAAILFSLMTVDSASRHWRKQASSWKDRTYNNNIAKL